MQYFVLYLLLINAATLLLMQKDKQKAQRHQWRIPEIVLMLSSLLGGSLGVLLGMCLFHHKTKHALFTVGIPLILLAQMTVLALLFS